MPSCCLMRDRKVVNLDGRRGKGEFGGVEETRNHNQSILYEKNFNKEKKKERKFCIIYSTKLNKYTCLVCLMKFLFIALCEPEEENRDSVSVDIKVKLLQRISEKNESTGTCFFLVKKIKKRKK